MQKARGHRTSLLPPLVGTRFQVLFHSPSGVLFTFPSRYSFTIGRQEYLALDGGPPRFPHERPSTVPPSTPSTPTQKQLQPIALSGFGLFPFRSPLLRE